MEHVFEKPISKSGSKCDDNNVRGISLPSAIAELFETLITYALTSYFATSLSSFQHDFMKGGQQCRI